MCLGIPGRIVEIVDAEKQLGRVDVLGAIRTISLILFHVLEVCPRHGWPQALPFMDNCRIAWGKVISADGSTLTVAVMPLLVAGHQLVLGPPEHRTVNRAFDGNGFVSTACTGEWVSIHWNWACQVLSPRQVANLERWTRYHLDIANQTL